MVDAPNHLARLAIIAAPEGSALRRMYSVSWAPIPDLGLDLVFLALRGFCSPQFVLQLCVLFAVVSILASAYVIQTAAFERPSWSVAFVPIFIFGIVWHVGLINYLMGVGVALIGIALFVRARRRLSGSLGILLGTIGLVALICHVAAFAAFMLLLSALHCAEELEAPSRAAVPALLRKGGQLMLVFLPGFLLYAICEKPDHTSGIHYSLVLSCFCRCSPFSERATMPMPGYSFWRSRLYLLLGLCGGIRVWRPGRPALILLTAIVLLIPGRSTTRC